MSNQVSFISVNQHSDGQRLDNFLLGHLKGAPKSLIYRIIRSGEVRINKKRAKPSSRLVVEDTIRIPPIKLTAHSSAAKPSASLAELLTDTAVIYEDDNLLVINKPAGLAVHAGSGVALGLIEALRQLRPHDEFLELVHRLDRATSGCLLLAKNRPALLKVQEQLTSLTLEKNYLAWVLGDWPAKLTEINQPLEKHTTAQGDTFIRPITKTAAHGKKPKPALTHFKLLDSKQGLSLIQASPITGRTHQIRVHAQAAGFPLVGDPKYGNYALNNYLAKLRGKNTQGLGRMFLHASELGLACPTSGKALRFTAPTPPEWNALSQLNLQLQEILYDN